MSEQAEKGEWPNNELPRTWAWIPFSEAWSDSTDSAKKLKQKEYLDEGPLPVVDQGEGLIGGFTDQLGLKNGVELPCIVFGDHTRAVKFIDFEFAQGADGVKVLRPNCQYDPEFAHHALRCVRLPNKGYSRHFKFLKSTRFPIPPLPEQRRIVAKLDRLSARSAAARDHLAHTTKLATRAKQAILRAAFSGELTKAWRATAPAADAAQYLATLSQLRKVEWLKGERRRKPDVAPEALARRYKEATISSVDGMPKLPDGWAWLSVEAISTKVSDGVHKKPDYVAEGIPFVTVKNLTAGDGISFENTNFVTESDHQEFIKRTDPEFGDILISKDGTLGVVRRVDTEKVFSIFVSVALVKPADRSMSQYLEYAFQSPQMQEQMVGVGSGLQHIHLTDLRKDLLPIAPVGEQNEIVRRIVAAFARIDRLADEATRAAHLLDRLDERLLAKAFRGELVPQDPEDEPAEALLARIRQARAAAPKPKRGRRKAS